MGDFLKGLAALVLMVAAFRWAVATVVDKAIANSDGTASGFKFETTPLVIPETNFNWNANWNLSPGLATVHGNEGDGDSEQEPAAATHSPPSDGSHSNDAATSRQREMREQVREMHEAIRHSSDPKAEMERIRARMRERQADR